MQRGLLNKIPMNIVVQITNHQEPCLRMGHQSVLDLIG